MLTRYLSEADFAERFSVSRRTLQRYRVTGDGPPWTRIGPRRIVYPLKAAEEWASARTFPHRAAELANRAVSAAT
ncbi:helix-turn-helix domain-containing protein [Roseomonas frigidaquae]|uniref:Helix-turn-helix domain-containing protein n=1 Tax=Falsiroseomonas frigidaquae TaxID=487318 RepID=A0ABX1F165_9PROT|nr:helix-turn-helix domain-containing protein [Falsiroseomonas frigidaquae]NKE46075.1 helix-turn-helix domain-containing protein [Falsiroseomonas frigidaquae]